MQAPNATRDEMFSNVSSNMIWSPKLPLSARLAHNMEQRLIFCCEHHNDLVM